MSGGILFFYVMEISVCIVLMVVSLVVGGVLTYFGLSRKYAQEISDLEVQILEVQRKGNHYRENIEDKLLHAQNAADDRKRELQAALLSQKNTENKYQQSQTQLKEKNTQLNEANAELKKLRKENDKVNKEKSALLAEKGTLLKDKEALLAENEFWLSEFDAKKEILMSAVSYNNEPFPESKFEEDAVESVQVEENIESEYNEAENVVESLQVEENIESEYKEEEPVNEEVADEVEIYTDAPTLLNEEEKEELISDSEVATESVVIPQASEQNVENEPIIEEINTPVEAIVENEEEDTIIMPYPLLTENENTETKG